MGRKRSRGLQRGNPPRTPSLVCETVSQQEFAGQSYLRHGCLRVPRCSETQPPSHSRVARPTPPGQREPGELSPERGSGHAAPAGTGVPGAHCCRGCAGRPRGKGPSLGRRLFCVSEIAG